MKMTDARFEDLTAFRAEGLSWEVIASQYPGTNARALGKAFSVARLARGGAPLRKDKPTRKPAVPADNGDLLTEVKNSLKAEIERYEAALKALERLAS